MVYSEAVASIHPSSLFVFRLMTNSGMGKIYWNAKSFLWALCLVNLVRVFEIK